MLDGIIADVGREYLEGNLSRTVAQAFEHDHGERVGFLTRRAPGYPGAEWPVAGVLADDAWDHVLLERLERVGLAEEAGHVDQNVAVERQDLVGIFPQEAHVVLDAGQLVQQDAALQPTFDRRQLVLAEIDAGGGAQQRKDALEVLVADVFGGGVRRQLAGRDDRRHCIVRDAGDLAGEVRG